MICPISDSFLCHLCSKLDTSVDFTAVKEKDKLKSYKVGEEITCFVSKVSLRNVMAVSAFDQKFQIYI